MGRTVIDDESGVVLGVLDDGDRIIRKASIDHLKNYQVWTVEHFFKGNMPEINKWMEELSPHEKALLFTVSTYVSYEDCCLKHSNGDMLTFDDIVKKSGIARGTTSETLNSLIDKDILYRGKNSRERQYFMNPWLFCKGNRINRVLKTMFRNYRIRICQNVKWGNLKD